MYAEKDQIEQLVESVVSGKIITIDELQNHLARIFKAYYKKEWNWCSSVLKGWKNFELKNFTISELKELLTEWKTGAIKFNNMVLKDAEKEFDQLSRIGFGPDGDETEQLADFENIRGKYETNHFVVGLKNEIIEIEKKYNNLIELLSGLDN
jgi:hypothetical protein